MQPTRAHEAALLERMSIPDANVISISCVRSNDLLQPTPCNTHDAPRSPRPLACTHCSYGKPDAINYAAITLCDFVTRQ